MTVTPFRLSGNELIALLVNIVPEKTLWSSLRIMGLLSDVDEYENISDSFPPSEEVVIRGTQALIDRKLLSVSDGVATANPEIEAVGLAFAQPKAVLTYQSVSDEVEFTSVIVDTDSGYRVVMDFVSGSSYEVTLAQTGDTDITEFFAVIANAIASSFKTFLFDIAYFTKSDDILTAYIACTPNAPEEMLESLGLPAGGYWVISADVPFEGDETKVYRLGDDDEEFPIFRSEFTSLDSALKNLQLRLLTEVRESESELKDVPVA